MVLVVVVAAAAVVDAVNHGVFHHPVLPAPAVGGASV